MIPKKSESKYLSALPKIVNWPSLLMWRSAMPSITFGPFRLLGNAHLFNWLFRWLVGIDMWCWSCRPEVRIWRRVREKFDKFRICWECSKFERCQIRMRTSSHPYCACNHMQDYHAVATICAILVTYRQHFDQLIWKVQPAELKIGGSDWRWHCATVTVRPWTTFQICTFLFEFYFFIKFYFR